MGDIKNVIDQTIEEMNAEGLLYGDAETNAQAVSLMWKLWDAAYRDGYKDGQEDVAEELAL